MQHNNLISQIKEDFSKFKDKALAILLYGSYANGEFTQRSDVDICIVAGDKEKAKKLYQETLSLQARNPKYDIHIFELLPLYLKNEIINHHKIIFTQSPVELSYYFFIYRKLWKDQAIDRL